MKQNPWLWAFPPWGSFRQRGAPLVLSLFSLLANAERANKENKTYKSSTRAKQRTVPYSRSLRGRLSEVIPAQLAIPTRSQDLSSFTTRIEPPSSVPENGTERVSAVPAQDIVNEVVVEVGPRLLRECKSTGIRIWAS